MNIKIAFACIIMVNLVTLSSCDTCKNQTDITVTDESQYNEPYVSTNDINNVQIVGESGYYKIVESEYLYYYNIYNKNHDIVKSGGPFNRQPHIAIINGELLRFTLQAGTGKGTKWGYYYDINKDIFSEVFQSIHDENNWRVAYGVSEKIVVRDIFDKNKYYYEITSFKYSFSPVVEPIKDVDFVNNGTSVEVTYLTGSDYQEVKEIIDLI